ncbi:MAG: hypothetical protein NZM42_05430 [Gemmatales bacterium]|nr:hypothetical protein [Gemmatales bacterium]MDW8222313.1 hypothetical protein [Gemmatales bacterium]
MPTDARLGVAVGVVITLLSGLLIATRPQADNPGNATLRQLITSILAPIQTYLPAPPPASPRPE